MGILFLSGIYTIERSPVIICANYLHQRNNLSSDKINHILNGLWDYRKGSTSYFKLWKGASI